MAQKILTRERQLQALALKRSGLTYSEIAERLGYSSAKSAGRAVRRLLDKFEIDESEEYRKVQVLRLEGMLATLAPKIEQGNTSAIAQALQIMDRLDNKVGVQNRVVTTSTVHHTVSVDLGEADYVKSLAAMSPALPSRTGEPMPEGANPFMADVVEAELVE